MFIVTVDIDKCKACGDCVETCPVSGLVLERDEGKQYVVFTLTPDDCLGCLSCQEGCPDGAITVAEY
jgi:2-oxoglutarate ferredoxin oxidoreductase subunit delta